MQKIDLSIVIPCFRSEFYLARNVEQIYASVADLKRTQIQTFEIILVVDGSPDDTMSVARNLEDKYAEIRTVQLTKNFGQHPAIFAGIQEAKMPWILTMDDDGQHPAGAITKMLEVISPDIDVVYAVSQIEEHGIYRNFMSRKAKFFIFRMLRIENSRDLSAFRIFRKSLVNDIKLSELTNGVVDVVLNWATTRFASVEIEMKKRSEGQSNYSIPTLFKFAIQMITGYSTKPLRFITFVGCASFFFSILGALVVLVEWVFGRITVPGYTTIVFLILIMGSLQLVALGIMSEYLARIHEKSMGKPLFSIRRDNSQL